VDVNDDFTGGFALCVEGTFPNENVLSKDRKNKPLINNEIEEK
jgi:predicted molibdopterin-dependent oxidoreductase YjgC